MENIFINNVHNFTFFKNGEVAVVSSQLNVSSSASWSDCSPLSNVCQWTHVDYGSWSAVCCIHR